jgi:DNA-binding MarR family transcriptional regulator
MNVRNHIIDLLTRTGLTRSEAEVYVAVSKNPGSELSDIRKETGYSSATVYRAFEKLKGMGFITSSPGNWRKKIEAVSLRVIGEKIAREQRKLRKVELELKRLDDIFHVSSGIEMADPVEVITDRNLIIEKNFEILSRPWEQFQAYGEGEVLADVLGKDFDREFIDIRRRKGKSCLLVLTELGPYGNELMKNSRMDLRETLYSTEPALHNSINYIYGDEVTIWNRNPEMGNRALVIKDPSLVKMHKSIFEMLHKKSKSDA